MSGPVTGVEIGRQFWVSDTVGSLKEAIGVRRTTTSSTSSTTQTTRTDLTPPDKSFVNFVKDGKGAQFTPAINAARIESAK